MSPDLVTAVSLTACAPRLSTPVALHLTTANQYVGLAFAFQRIRNLLLRLEFFVNFSRLMFGGPLWLRMPIRATLDPEKVPSHKRKVSTATPLSTPLSIGYGCCSFFCFPHEWRLCSPSNAVFILVKAFLLSEAVQALQPSTPGPTWLTGSTRSQLQ